MMSPKRATHTFDRSFISSFIHKFALFPKFPLKRFIIHKYSSNKFNSLLHSQSVFYLLCIRRLMRINLSNSITDNAGGIRWNRESVLLSGLLTYTGTDTCFGNSSLKLRKKLISMRSIVIIRNKFLCILPHTCRNNTRTLHRLNQINSLLPWQTV